MQVYLDDKLLAARPDSVADALEAGRVAAEAAGRLVIEVHADGHPIDQGMLDQPPADDAGISELRLVSTAPGPFIRTTLLDAVDLLGQIRVDQVEAVKLFHTGHIEEAFEPLQRALQSWAILRDVVDKGSTLGLIDVESVQVPSRSGQSEPGTGFISTLMEHLTEVKRSLEIQDFTALADVLEGGLEAEVGRWEEFLRAMADAAAQP
ncbi:MAG: hypothetical protein D6695_00855 [Planctomycetota bacterium]|nr:MAG: hypothetical protein D6695_00855 [Planctomycetota bacterium]